jgi:hypothetical protein
MLRDCNADERLEYGRLLDSLVEDISSRLRYFKLDNVLVQIFIRDALNASRLCTALSLWFPLSPEYPIHFAIFRL